MFFVVEIMRIKKIRSNRDDFVHKYGFWYFSKESNFQSENLYCRGGGFKAVWKISKT